MRLHSAVGLLVSVCALWSCSTATTGKSRFDGTGGVGSSGLGGGSGMGGSGVTPGIATGGSWIAPINPIQEDPCKKDPTLEKCQLVPSGPACGDSKVNQDTEKCDDGNGLAGDGCNGKCEVEKYFECPPQGGPCVSTIKCGDGVLGPGEACDDLNTNSGDGCAGACRQVEKGYVCPTAGMPCKRVFVCGDGVTDPNEGCDDGNKNAGDGCDPKCRLEAGYKCEGTPVVCSRTTCGDGKREGAESCDDGNAYAYDGCFECKSEPDCRGGPCASKCGDGILLDEACDDGNVRDGDGCSSKCTVETGFECAPKGSGCVGAGAGCKLQVPVVYRDFGNAGDFTDVKEEKPNQLAITGLVKSQLDADGKPEWSGKTGWRIASDTSFKEWYRKQERLGGTITLCDNGKGGFVNRWDDNCTKWKGYKEAQDLSDYYKTATEGVPPTVPWCGEGGSKCANGTATGCADTAPPRECVVAVGNADAGQGKGILGLGYDTYGTPTEYDGNPVFFPIDTAPNPAPLSLAKVPPAYGYNWTPEPNGKSHNFHFTTEVRYWFKYDQATNARLEFTGDDDVWVFVNKRLAVDLGGWHPPLDGGFTIDSTSAAATGGYGLEQGKVYEVSVFHAERQIEGSSFRLTLSGFSFESSDCSTNCGDGAVAAGEECDDGAASNTGDYGKCSPGCTLGPRCGDGLVQKEFAEECDDGTMNNDGAYGHCSPTCKNGPHCGDSVVDKEREECDDGVFSGNYGECAPGCVRAPYCGDGKLTLPYEDCDDHNINDHDGCSAGCKEEVGPNR